jgi:hypothetical protein
MIALKHIPTRTEVTADQIAKHLARLGCTEQQIQLHLQPRHTRDGRAEGDNASIVAKGALGQALGGTLRLTVRSCFSVGKFNA